MECKQVEWHIMKLRSRGDDFIIVANDMSRRRILLMRGVHLLRSLSTMRSDYCFVVPAKMDGSGGWQLVSPVRLALDCECSSGVVFVSSRVRWKVLPMCTVHTA